MDDGFSDHPPVLLDFEQNFIDAVNVFKYQRIFDVIPKTLQPLKPNLKGKTAQDYPGAGDPSIAEVNTVHVQFF